MNIIKIKRIFIISIIILLVFVVTSSVVSVLIYFIHTENESSNKVCLSAGCNKSSSTFLQNMNLDVNPCDDFYEFACGKFMNNTEIPDDESSVTMMKNLDDLVKQQVKDLLEESIQSKDLHVFILAKNLYKACINESAIENRGVEPLREILTKLGEWPVLTQQNWKQKHFNWISTVLEIGKLGYSTSSILSLEVDIDPKNNTNRMLSIDQPKLNLMKDYFTQGLENNIVQAYFDYMKNVAIYLGADNNTVENELFDCLQFETTLASYSLSIEERKDMNKLYHPMTVRKLKQNYPSIPWMDLINKMLPSSLKIRDNEIILNVVPDYIKNLEKLLKRTPKRTIANYLIWNVVKETVPLLSKDLVKFLDQFNSVIVGKTSQPPRWKGCTSFVSNSMDVAVGSLYIQKYFDRESAGILQGFFFARDRPQYLNYGSIGFVIGHEITHGFDDFGRQFDKNGNLVDWWDPATNEAFLKKAKCIIDQYGNYSVENRHINGVSTQGENIADNGGIKIAYQAYNKNAEDSEVELRIPKLEEYTPKQMFWISAATVWCSKYRPKFLEFSLVTDSHSPGKFRVNGVVSNQEMFARDFRCPVGSKMNPEHKCRVW